MQGCRGLREGGKEAGRQRGADRMGGREAVEEGRRQRLQHSNASHRAKDSQQSEISKKAYFMNMFWSVKDHSSH